MQHAKKEGQNGDRMLGGETLGVQLSLNHQSIKLALTPSQPNEKSAALRHVGLLAGDSNIVLALAPNMKSIHLFRYI